EIEDLVLENLDAAGRGNAFRDDQIFRAPRDAVQQAAVPAVLEVRVRPLRLFERELVGERDDAVELRADARETIEVHLRQLDAGDLAGVDEAREVANGGEGERGDVTVVFRQIFFAEAEDRVAARNHFAGHARVEAHGRLDGRVDRPR